MWEQKRLHKRQHWIFDLDGTLTVSAHDFDFIRSELGLKEKAPILEALNAMPAEQSAPLWQRLNELECHFAGKATIMDGSRDILEKLAARGARLGILTRNVMPVVIETLKACDIAHLFPADCIVDRDLCTPKPSPDGIHHLRKLWQADPEDTVMVGDYLYDLQSGKSAGVTTIHLDSRRDTTWPEYTDVYIRNFAELTALVG
ncbi:MAG: HAD superfamily hydrolase (TIGR01509 family) [Planctomycetota bacterium]|jgi:HAD superfamily hydrolase (TIGR01509 family)